MKAAMSRTVSTLSAMIQFLCIFATERRRRRRAVLSFNALPFVICTFSLRERKRLQWR